MTDTILVTGATGAFGRYLVRRLMSHSNAQLVLIVRAATDADARARVSEHGELPDRVEVIAGDLSERLFGLSDEAYAALARRVTHILHAAASTRFNSPLDVARVHNVLTTQHMLEFAAQCSGLKRFGHLSTVMVAGKRTGVITETDHIHTAGFTNTYQQSKYEAEQLVRSSGLPCVVFRTPFIYAPEEMRAQGKPTNFLSLLINLVAQGRVPFVLGQPDSTMDLITESLASDTLTQLFLKKTLTFDTYQIAHGAACVTIKTFHSMIETEKGSAIPIYYCGNGDAGVQALASLIIDHPELVEIYRRAESFLAEPAYPKVFDNAHVMSELGLATLGEGAESVLRSAVHRALWTS